MGGRAIGVEAHSDFKHDFAKLRLPHFASFNRFAFPPNGRTAKVQVNANAVQIMAKTPLELHQTHTSLLSILRFIFLSEKIQKREKLRINFKLVHRD